MSKAERALEDILHCDRVLLTPAQVAPVLGCAPYAINIQAREDASKLGFPVIMIGTRVKIPRLSFLQFIGGIQNVTVTLDREEGAQCG